MSKSQIQSQINSLKREKQSCIQDKDSYQAALEYANKVVGNLNNADSYLESAVDDLDKYFVINNKAADNDRLNKCLDTVRKMTTKFNNTIIPGIHSEIGSLESRISSIDSEISNLNKELAALETSGEDS